MKKERVKAEDYQSRDRPSNRIAQYGDIFKHRFVELLKLSLLQAVFNMPFIVSLIIFYVAVRNSSDLNQLMTVFLIQGASFVVSVPCIFTGLTGVFYCLKKIAFADGEYASSSFFIGLKEEWKNGLLVGLLVGFSAFIGLFGFFAFYFYVSQFDKIISGFGIAIVIIQLMLVLMVAYLSISQIVCYSNQLRYILKNSFIFMLVRFPFNLLFLILYPGILIALFSIMEITMYVGIALLLFFSCLGHLMWLLMGLSTFDKFVNKVQYPDMYRKGLKDIQTSEEV